MDIYSLYRNFWDFAFSNPDKIKPNHCAVFSFSIEHCNRLGWKSKFGFPTSMAMEATGIKSYSVYKKTFEDLISFGFFDIIQYSKNQYSSNIIALKENNKAHSKAINKALDKALIKHTSRQCESTHKSTDQSNDSIIKQETNKQINNKTINTEFILEPDFRNLIDYWIDYRIKIKKPIKTQIGIEAFFNSLKNKSEGNLEIAKQIIQQSIANEWQGIFPLKNNKDEHTKNIGNIKQNQLSSGSYPGKYDKGANL